MGVVELDVDDVPDRAVGAGHALAPPASAAPPGAAHRAPRPGRTGPAQTAPPLPWLRVTPSASVAAASSVNGLACVLAPIGLPLVCAGASGTAGPGVSQAPAAKASRELVAAGG